MKKGKPLRWIIAAAMSLCLTLGCTTAAYADKSKEYGSIKEIIKIINDDELELSDIYLSENDDPSYYGKNLGSYVVSSPYIERIELPESYDLRDVDGKCYVTEAKSQMPFNTCWAFSPIASAEISIATALDIDLNTATDEQKKALDLSERHLVWFAYTPIPENDPIYPEQAGEGCHLFVLEDTVGLSDAEISNAVMNNGGYITYGSYLFSAGIGPALESDAPYINDEGYYYILGVSHVDANYDFIDQQILKEGFSADTGIFDDLIEEYNKKYPRLKDLYNGNIEYDPDALYSYICLFRENGSWSVDESKRYNSAYRFIGVDMLPCPAGYSEESGYVYNELGTYAIKKAVSSGHGVCICLAFDEAYPEIPRDPDDTFFKFTDRDGNVTTDEFADVWASYAYDKRYDPSDSKSVNLPISANHGVVIVGYDDNFPKERFNDPKGTIGGNGAFIAKNSWGSAGSSDPLSGPWGNGGDGYFYISYYDQSLDRPLTYLFDKGDEPDVRSLNTDMYDLCPNDFCNSLEYTDYKVCRSNVFMADENEFVAKIGLYTPSPNCTVEYAVYLLDDNYAAPTDGVKMNEGSIRLDYAGYHVIDFDKRVPVRKGQRYSVILSSRREDGKYCLDVESRMNRNSISILNDYLRRLKADENDNEDTGGYLTGYGECVVNQGESFIGAETEKGMEWMDLSELIAVVTSDNENVLNNGISYENFCVRAYPQTEIISAENVIRDAKESYTAGDYLRGSITITNNGTETLRDVELSLTLGKIGKDNKHGKISRIAPGKSKTINYVYKVRNKDAENGSITSTLTLSVGENEHKIDAEVYPLSFTVGTDSPAA